MSLRTDDATLSSLPSRSELDTLIAQLRSTAKTDNEAADFIEAAPDDYTPDDPLAIAQGLQLQAESNLKLAALLTMLADAAGLHGAPAEPAAELVRVMVGGENAYAVLKTGQRHYDVRLSAGRSVSAALVLHAEECEARAQQELSIARACRAAAASTNESLVLPAE